MSVEIKDYAREPAIFVKGELYDTDLVIYKCTADSVFPNKFNITYSSGGLGFSFYVSKETLVDLGEKIKQLDTRVEECRTEAKEGKK